MVGRHRQIYGIADQYDDFVTFLKNSRWKEEPRVVGVEKLLLWWLMAEDGGMVILKLVIFFVIVFRECEILGEQHVDHFPKPMST